MDTYLQTAIFVSIEAGIEIMRVFNTKIRISIKRNFTPVTNADKIANQIIINRLAQFNIPLISEESKVAPYQERSKWDYLWLVDPLDGTKEFIAHSNDFTVNIALIHKNYPVMGVIYAPAYDVLYFASEAQGSYRLNKASTVLQENKSIEWLLTKSIKLPDCKTEKYTYVVSRSHINHKTQKYLEKNLNEKIFIGKGSSLKLCAIAEGSADEYPRFGRTMEWDIAAGDAIMRYAGAKVQIFESAELLHYNKPEMANPEFIASKG
ncbi:MAG: 3'(2'),5'-bisphosphate nucleotidase CysQ [Bacteroidota bacterium]